MLNVILLMCSLTAPAGTTSLIVPIHEHVSLPLGRTLERLPLKGTDASGQLDEGPERSCRWWQKLTCWGGRKEVLISGHVVSPYSDMRDVLVLAELPDGSIHGSRSGENGRFTVSLPLEAEVRLRFRKAGHVEKVVMVDTRNAVDGRRARRRSRGVSFDVELLPEERLSGFTYDGPVGTISFVRGSGLMKVTYHEQLIQLSSLR